MFAFRGHPLWDLATGEGETGLHQLGLRDVCKEDVGVVDVMTESWEDLALDRSGWGSTFHAWLPAEGGG